MFNFLSSSASIRRIIPVRLAIATALAVATFGILTTITVFNTLLSIATALLVAPMAVLVTRRLLALPLALKFRATVIAKISPMAWHWNTGIQF